MIFILIFVAYQHLLLNLNLSKSYECSEPPAEKQERRLYITKR